MADERAYPHLLRRDAISAGERTFSHPWNPRSEVTGTHLSPRTGLERTGVSLVRIRPGKESYAYHVHHRKEEWIYILSGSGTALIDGREYAVDPGDFIAFPTPSVAHNMRNPNDEDLVYLMGGENLDFEVADFPLLDKRMIRRGSAVEIYKLSDGRPFGPEESP
jgi:uncharacterized cupin superfamily protein